MPRLNHPSELQVRQFDTRIGQEILEFVGVRHHLGFRPVIPFCQFAPHGIQTEFCQSAFRGDTFYRLFVWTDPLARDEIGNVAILVLRVSKPGRITSLLHLQFQKCIYILDKETALIRLRIVLHNDIFKQFLNADDVITVLHGQPNFIYDPRTTRLLFIDTYINLHKYYEFLVQVRVVYVLTGVRRRFNI